MLSYLGRLLSVGRRPLRVSYLSKAEAEPAWRDGWLLSVDNFGASFAAGAHEGEVECLPWGSIGGIRISPEAVGGTERPAFFGAGEKD